MGQYFRCFGIRLGSRERSLIDSRGGTIEIKFGAFRDKLITVQKGRLQGRKEEQKEFI